MILQRFKLALIFHGSARYFQLLWRNSFSQISLRWAINVVREANIIILRLILFSRKIRQCTQKNKVLDPQSISAERSLTPPSGPRGGSNQSSAITQQIFHKKLPFYKADLFLHPYFSPRLKAMYCWDKTASCIHEWNFSQCQLKIPPVGSLP